MTTRGNPEKGGEPSLQSESVSAAKLTQYLKGIDFPAEKSAVIKSAKSNGAPENVMSFMNRLPDKTYNRSTEIEEEFGKLK